MSLKSSAVTAGFCVTRPMWMWSIRSSPAQQGFPLGDRFLCSTFSRRKTCLQILFFMFQPFCQTPGLFGICGRRNPEGSGSCCLPLQAPAHLAELRHPLPVQAHNALLFPDFWKHREPEKAGNCQPQKQVFKGAFKAVYLKDLGKIFSMIPLY